MRSDMIENLKEAFKNSLGNCRESPTESGIEKLLFDELGNILNSNKNVEKQFKTDSIEQLQFTQNGIRNNPWENIVWTGPVKPKVYNNGRKVDIAIKGHGAIKALIELKYINKHEINNSSGKTCYNFLLAKSDIIESKDHTPKNNQDLKAPPIIEKNGKKFLTFFQEGQIWWDIVKLLSLKEQHSRDTQHAQLYSLGFMQRNHIELRCYKNVIEYFILGRIKKIIDILKENYQDQYRVIASFKPRNAKYDSKIWIDYTSLNFTEEIDVFSVSSEVNNFVAYIIKITPCNSRTKGCT